MKYFANINTLDELKKLYKKLALENHPDRGGDTATMQEINAEYTTAFENIQKGCTNENDLNEIPEQFIDIINAIISFVGLDIEICGTWIWVSGETKTYKDQLKSLNFKWASKKMMWYWRRDEDQCRSKRKLSMDEIRVKYGSDKISCSYRYQLA